MDENIALYAPAVIKWASSIPYSVRIYLFGSRIFGTPRADSDLDIAIEFMDTDAEDDEVWLDCHKYWARQLSQLIPCAPHLVQIDDDATKLKKYLQSGVLIYETGIYNILIKQEAGGMGGQRGRP